MRLATFILTGMESILAEWEAYAATMLPAAVHLTSLALRDHAPQILQAIAVDMQTAQTRQAQADKSRGKAPVVPGAPETAAQTHALLRAKSGFEIVQLIAEYRALRASVLRLWMDAHAPAEETLQDVIRFNEAIDQAIAESVGFFHDEVEMTRNLLIGTLGHDMRNPLNTNLLTASYLTSLNAGEKVSESAARLVRSGASMKNLLDDLLDFSRTRLGLGIRMTPVKTDLAALSSDEVQQFHVSHPNRRIELAVSGDTTGCWDGPRLQQLLRNLISNGLTHGTPGGTIHVALDGEGADVKIAVSNSGPPIERHVLERMFNPLERGPDQSDRRNATEGLGLGLYIVQEIARGHGGEVTVNSRDGKTEFSVRLPRRLHGATI